MTFKNFVVLSDLSASPLWDGEPVYLLATSINFNGGSILNLKNKTLQTIAQNTTDTTAGDSDFIYINNYNRRKNNVSYGGFKNMEISITLVFDMEKIGNSLFINGAERKIFTPSKLMELILKPRTLYLKDHSLCELLSFVQDTSPAIISFNGFPVVLNSYTITPDINSKQIIIDLSFIEDKVL